MAIIAERNSLNYISRFNPLRCDTHFKKYIKISDEFFLNDRIEWVSLGSVLAKVRNGLNASTSLYSMEETDTLYLSVSQIKEYGLIKKNQNYLTDDVYEDRGFFELEENTVIITRSGTIGVALSTDHQSFDLENKTYVASGFVITAQVLPEYNSTVIADYINLFYVQNYLTAMAAGACQKNIAQPTIKNLPVPECLLSDEAGLYQYFDEYANESQRIMEDISTLELELDELKSDISSSISEKINQYYK